MTTSPHEYDVCLSFAGEQRAYVDEVAAKLAENGVKTFYDRYEQVDLWGKDLYEHLDSVYRQKARYCIIFVSADYARKVWTNHERRSAQARALQESREYILPVRFDDTELPGLRPTVGHVDTRSTPLPQLVTLVCEKLATLGNGTNEDSPATYTSLRVPYTSEEQRFLIQAKPRGWEYLLFGGVLVQGKIALEPKNRDHFLRYARTVRHIADDGQALDFISDTTARGQKLMADGIMRVLDNEAQEWAFGPLGTPGNVDNIIHLGQRFIRIYEDMLDWAADVRGTGTSARLRRAFDLAAQLMDDPISQVGHFIDRYAEISIGMTERLTNGEKVEVELELALSINEQVSKECRKELRKIRRAVR